MNTVADVPAASPWDVTVELAGGRWHLALAACLYLAAAAGPWAAGCDPVLASGLSFVILAGLPAALRALPGPRCPLTRLGYRDGEWRAWDAGGRVRPAAVVAGTRCLPGLALCRLVVAGRRIDLWVSRYTAVRRDDFRRLIVALRCSRPVPGS